MLQGKEFISVTLSRQGLEGANMEWTMPSYIDMRFGFEITMYIAVR
jgi:coenzyme PQQ precursor peptide PqqA